MKYLFVAEESENLGGELGWRLKSRADFDPITGVGVAHDIMEHPSCKICPHPIPNELMAFGTIFWLRLDTGYFTSEEILKSVASELFEEVFEKHFFQDECFSLVPCPSKTKPLINDWAESWLEEFCNHFFRKIIDSRQEVSERWESQESWELSRECDDFQELLDYVPSIKDWMRRGWRHAENRYEGKSKYDLMLLFKRIAELADKELTYCEFPGATLELQIDFCRYCVEAKVIPLPEEDY